MNKYPIGPRVAANRQPCSEPRCTRPRHGASLFCNSHKRAKAAHGHPQGRRIFPHDYAIERCTVAAILRDDPSHEGVKHAAAWLDLWLKRAAGGDTNAIGQAEFARLAAAGVSGRKILEECAAVWMFAHRYPRTLPDDIRLTFALSAATLHTAPRYLRKAYRYARYTDRRYVTAPKSEREAIGKAIRETIGALLYTIATEPDRTAQAREAMRKAMFSPFHRADLTIPHPTTQ